MIVKTKQRLVFNQFYEFKDLRTVRDFAKENGVDAIVHCCSRTENPLEVSVYQKRLGEYVSFKTEKHYLMEENGEFVPIKKSTVEKFWDEPRGRRHEDKFKGVKFVESENVKKKYEEWEKELEKLRKELVEDVK